MKLAHFVIRCCWSKSVFCLCEAGCFYYYCYVMCCYDISFFFSCASTGNGYMFNLFTKQLIVGRVDGRCRRVLHLFQWGVLGVGHKLRSTSVSSFLEPPVTPTSAFQVHMIWPACTQDILSMFLIFRKHVSKTGSVSIFRWGGRHLFCRLPQKELISITGHPKSDSSQLRDPTPEDGNRCSFRNAVFSSFYWAMDEVRNPSHSVCYTP
jgi:hypothetical protein